MTETIIYLIIYLLLFVSPFRVLLLLCWGTRKGLLRKVVFSICFSEDLHNKLQYENLGIVYYSSSYYYHYCLLLLLCLTGQVIDMLLCRA